MITLVHNGPTNKKLFWDNGKYLGYCYVEVDGYYVFVNDPTNNGAWSDYVLRAIADVLTELNKEWDKVTSLIK